MNCSISLAEPLPLAPGDRFVLRANAGADGQSGLVTIGGGRILGTSNTRLRRKKPWTLSALAARREALEDPALWCELMLREGGAPLSLRELQSKCMMRAEELAVLVESLRAQGKVVQTPSGVLASHVLLEEAAARMLKAVQTFHQANPQRSGLTREELLEILVEDAQNAYTKREADIDAIAGAGSMRQLERNVLLNVLDRKWREHLYEMDYLKEGIGLRAMAQRDPLVEYQREGYDMFTGMLEAVKEESVGFLFNVQVEAAPQAPTLVAQPMPEGLRAKGLAQDESRPLTYVGPSEDGDAEIQRHDAALTAATGGGSRRERRGAKRQQSREQKLVRRR